METKISKTKDTIICIIRDERILLFYYENSVYIVKNLCQKRSRNG